MLNCCYYKDFKIVRHTEINHKCCKNVVKTDLPLANHCYIRACKTATIEWNSLPFYVDDSLNFLNQY